MVMHKSSCITSTCAAVICVVDPGSTLNVSCGIDGEEIHGWDLVKYTAATLKYISPAEYVKQGLGLQAVRLKIIRLKNPSDFVGVLYEFHP